MKFTYIFLLALEVAILDHVTSYGCSPVADCLVNPDAMVKDPHNCHVYYPCSGGVAQHGVRCPDYQWFNGAVCAPGDCIHHPSCANTCNTRCSAIGDLIPHPVNCGQYYVCSPSGLTLLSCNEGTFFDGTECTRYADNCCTFCHYDCDGVEEGQHVIDPNYCHKYYICDGNGGYLSNDDCPDGEYFNIGLGSCEPGECYSYCRL